MELYKAKRVHTAFQGCLQRFIWNSVLHCFSEKKKLSKVAQRLLSGIKKKYTTLISPKRLICPSVI